jgi:hypothetical protein
MARRRVRRAAERAPDSGLWGERQAERLLLEYAQRRVLQGAAAADPAAVLAELPADAALVQFVETQLAGAIGSASARVMVAPGSTYSRQRSQLAAICSLVGRCMAGERWGGVPDGLRRAVGVRCRG